MENAGNKITSLAQLDDSELARESQTAWDILLAAKPGAASLAIDVSPDALRLASADSSMQNHAGREKLWGALFNRQALLSDDHFLSALTRCMGEADA